MTSFALVGAITPGPVNVLALRHGSQGPHRLALCYVLGASVSYVGVVACMGWSSAQLLLQMPYLSQSAQWLCAAYLLWLAWQLARTPTQASEQVVAQVQLRPWQAFGQGVMVQTLNPKAWLFALSAVGVFVLPAHSPPQASLAVLCAISLLACLLGVGCWAMLGRALVHWLRTPRRQQVLHRALAGLLVLSVLTMLA